MGLPLRRWSNVKSTLIQRIVSAGLSSFCRDFPTNVQKPTHARNVFTHSPISVLPGFHWGGGGGDFNLFYLPCQFNYPIRGRI